MCADFAAACQTTTVYLEIKNVLTKHIWKFKDQVFLVGVNWFLKPSSEPLFYLITSRQSIAVALIGVVGGIFVLIYLVPDSLVSWGQSSITPFIAVGIAYFLIRMDAS